MAKGKKTGGRVAGTPNKATRELKDIAREYGEEAIDRLVKLMRAAESEQVQAAACKELMDRGYGKPSQSIGLGQAPDLEPIETAVRPTLTRDQWLLLHQSPK